MTGKTTPLYVVCSPRRCVGKTLISRLLVEFYVVKDRPVVAFDLAVHLVACSARYQGRVVAAKRRSHILLLARLSLRG